MTTSKLALALALFATQTLALGGCANEGAPAEKQENTANEGEAVISNGGGGASEHFWCAEGFCTCTGDEDCNDMYSGGACTSAPGICQISPTDIPRCRCTAAAVKHTGFGAVAVGAATAATTFSRP